MKNEYYLDDFVFEDDPLLSSQQRKAFRNRGGSGLVDPVLLDGMLHVNRKIVLDLNIPDYE